MDIRFDPRLPLVWRDPNTLQIGVDHPIAVVDRLSARQEKIIAAIAAGHGRSGLGSIAQRSGCREREVEELVEVLRPTFAAPRSVSSGRLRVGVSGTGPMADEISGLLEAGGAAVHRVTAESVMMDPPPDIGVAVSRHVHDPGVAGAWLRRDVAFLCVVAGDSTTRVGPLVVPGVTACPRCLDLHRGDVDLAWGVIAGQLWGRPAPEHPPLARLEASTRSVRRVLRRGAEDDAVIEMLDVDSGDITRTTSRPHPSCGCAVLPRSDSADDPSRLGLARHGSTTGAGVAALA